MKKLWKAVGAIGSFFFGFVIGKMFMSSVLTSPYLTFITNDNELTLGFAVLIGLFVAVWWMKEYDER